MDVQLAITVTINDLMRRMGVGVFVHGITRGTQLVWVLTREFHAGPQCPYMTVCKSRLPVSTYLCITVILNTGVG